MIKGSRKRGFVLPFVILISASLLVLVTLLTKHSSFKAEQLAIQSVHRHTEQSLRMNVPILIDQFNEILAQSPSTTLLDKTSDPEINFHESQIALDRDEDAQPLGSAYDAENKNRIGFHSAVSENVIVADAINLSVEEDAFRTSIAWTVEDVSALSTNEATPQWWPLDSWQLSPINSSSNDNNRLAELTGIQPGNINISPVGEPIHFDEQNSPAFTAVIQNVRLRFGIFASGKVGQREKILRMRYYLECSVWNPYNRNMRMHSRSKLEPVFQLVFRNLPTLKITNQSNGISTGWISMDELTNPQSNTTGIHGWVRLPGELLPGQSVHSREPDNEMQPEGLARIVHPSFMMGPADEITVQFKPSSQGIQVACIPLNTDNPTSENQIAHAWFQLKNFTTEYPTLHFARADDPEHPFYLTGGSLSFRDANSQIEINVHRLIAEYINRIDPRQLILDSSHSYIDSAGSLISGNKLINVSATNLMDKPSGNTYETLAVPIVSWPTEVPNSVMALSDIPSWSNAYCLGSPAASLLNAIIDENWPNNPAPILQLQQTTGSIAQYGRTIPVNTMSPASWQRILKASNNQTGPNGFALYSNPSESSDYMEISTGSIDRASARLALLAHSDPCLSVSDFFNKGRLLQSFDFSSDNPLHKFLPLRSLAAKNVKLVDHGSSLIIHAACLTEWSNLHIIKYARIWLLEVPGGMTGTEFNAVRFEWANPEQHLVVLSKTQL